MPAPTSCSVISCLETLEPRQLLATWYVAAVTDPAEDGSAGHPFDAIQQAIDAAGVGDTIEVAAGSYSGDLTIDKADLRLIPAQGQTANILFVDEPGLRIDANGVTIGRSDGGTFVFAGGPATLSLISLADGLSGVSIVGSEFSTSDSAVAIDAGDSTDGLAIVGNTFAADGDSQSIVGGHLIRATIRQNRFTSASQSPNCQAIDLMAAAGGSDITSNWVQSYGVGIVIGGAGGLLVALQGNYFVSCGVGLQFADTGVGGVYSATVYGNTFMGNQTGLLVEGGVNVDPAAIHVYLGNSFTTNSAAIENQGTAALAVGPRIGNTVLPTGNGNWFGHRTGPLMNSNPAGKGDKVTGPMDFYGRTWAAVAPLLVPPNVTARLVAGGTDLTAIPGDTLTLNVEFTNENDFAIAGQMTVDIFLSADATAGAGDLLVQSTPFPVSILPGRKLVRQVKVYISTDFTPGSFDVVALANQGTVLEQAVGGSIGLDVAWMFGTLGTRRGAVLTLAGTTYTLSGGGYGLVSATGDIGVVDVQLVGTSSRSAVAIKAPAAITPWDIRDLTASDPVGSFAAARTAVVGDVTFGGGVASLTVGSIGGDAAHTMAIHTGARLSSVTLSLGVVNDLALTSDLPIRALTVTSWTPTAGLSRPNRIDAPAIAALTSAGDFSADIGSALAKVALSKATVTAPKTGGQGLYDSIWWLTGTVQALSLAKATDCTIYVDVLHDTTGLVTEASQFTASGAIRAMTIGSLTNTVIAAAGLGKVAITRGAPTLGEVAGLTTRRLQSMVYQKDAGKITLSNLTWANQMYQDGDFVLRIV